MRLLEVFQKPDYQPLERGEAFPQFHEDGDKYQWSNPMDWSFRFWVAGVQESNYLDHEFPTYLMGGEL